MTVSQSLDTAADAFPDRPLVITDERAYTYRDIQAGSREIAAGLIAQGIQPGDHVAMLMANYPEFVAIKFAIARVGAVAIPINYLFRGAELGYILRQSDAKLLIAMDRYRDLGYVDTLDEIAPGWATGGGGEAIPNLRTVVIYSPTGDEPEGATSLAQLTEAGTGEAREELERRENAADASGYSDILYTSGTTGSPKGVLLGHDQVVRMAYAAAYQRALEDGRRLGFPLPMYHVFGYMECLMAVLFVGGAIVPRVAFDAADSLESYARHRVNEIVAVPAVTLPLLAEIGRGDYDISSIHTVFSSGGAAPATIWDDIRDVFGDAVELTTGYGMTETTAATTCTMPEDDDEVLTTTNGRLRFAGAAGDPELGGLIAMYKAVDIQSGEDLPAGEQGHLLVRGPVVTHGYYNKPDETALAFTEDGWLRTGDIGSIDADGNLKLTGRLKESFRVGGEMVMPKEIENVLTSHPEVADAHVVGLPHVRMGEVGCAWIIPRDPENPPERDDLVEYCSSRLARFKVPRHIIFTSAAELPVTATGRVQKFRLTEMAQQRLTQQAPA
jgi:fatty-acyl-CoA synthase